MWESKIWIKKRSGGYMIQFPNSFGDLYEDAQHQKRIKEIKETKDGHIQPKISDLLRKLMAVRGRRLALIVMRHNIYVAEKETPKIIVADLDKAIRDVFGNDIKIETETE